MNGKKNEKSYQKGLQEGREQVAKPLAKGLHGLEKEMKVANKQHCDVEEQILDNQYQFETEKKDKSLGIERIITFNDLKEDHDVAIVVGIFRKYCDENGYCENSEEIHNFVKKIGNAERIPVFRESVSYEDIKKAEDRAEASELLFELISFCNSLWGKEYDENIYNRLCKNLTISQNDLECISKNISKNMEIYELSKWTEMLLGQTDRTDNTPDSYDNSGLSGCGEKAQDDAGFDYPLQEDDAKKRDEVIRGIVGKYAEKINGGLEHDAKQWEKILNDSGYSNIALSSVCAMIKSGSKKIVVTTHAVYYVGYVDKKKNWKIKYSDLKEVIYEQKEKVIIFRADEKHTIERKKDYESLVRMFDEIRENGQYTQSDCYIKPQNMERKNRMEYVAIACYIIKKAKCDDFEVFRLASKYKVEREWEVIVNLISDDKGYEAYLKDLMESQELIYSQKTVAVSLITEVCRSYMCAQDSYELSGSIYRCFDNLKPFLKDNIDKDDSNKALSATIEAARKEKEFLDNKVSLAEYRKAIENVAAIVGAAGIFGVAYAFAWGPLLMVFMSFAPGIGQIAAAAVAGGLLIKQVVKKAGDKKDEETSMKQTITFTYACEYAYAQHASEQIGDYETARKLKENRKNLLKKTNISFSVRVPNEEDDIFTQIRELFVNGLKECNSWESYSQISEETMRILKNVWEDVAVEYGIRFSEEDTIGIYKEKSWKDDYNYMKDNHLCRCIVFCKEGLLYKNYEDQALYVRYIDFDCVKMNDTYPSIALFYQPKGLGLVLGNEYDLPIIYEMLSKIFDIVKDGCTTYS